MCKHVGLGGHDLLHEIYAPSVMTRRVASGVLPMVSSDEEWKSETKRFLGKSDALKKILVFFGTGRT